MGGSFVSTLVTVVHIFTCVLLILVVLIQSGKGAEISASFSGSSQTVFGSSGGANFFTRFTQVAAGVFMVTSVLLTILGGESKKSMFDTPSSRNAPISAPAPGAPAAPAPGGAAAPAAPAQNAAPAPAPAKK
jgi:preprotein translocase subunit SecG